MFTAILDNHFTMLVARHLLTVANANTYNKTAALVEHCKNTIANYELIYKCNWLK